MAEIVWSEPALSDLDAIADFIAIENPSPPVASDSRPHPGWGIAEMGMALKVAFICSLISGAVAEPLQIGGPFDTPLGKKYRTELELLVVPTDRLPQRCRMLTEINTAPLGPASTNPFVTEDSQTIGYFATIGFQREDLPGATVGMSALYLDGHASHEVGVYVLGFSSAAAAKAASEKIIVRRVLRKGELLAMLWRDDETGLDCEDAVRAHLIRNGFKRKTEKP